MKAYVASSWREPRQQEVVKALLAADHDVYDFKNPPDGKGGFHWSQIDPGWEGWDSRQFVGGLEHPLAQSGFVRDREAMKWCDVCVHVVPHTAGRSSHLELGWCAGDPAAAVHEGARGDHPRAVGSEAHDQTVGWIKDNLHAFEWDVEIQEATKLGHPIRNIIARNFASYFVPTRYYMVSGYFLKLLAFTSIFITF